MMDTIFNIDTFSRFLTFAIFTVAGYDMSKSLPKLTNASTLLVIAAIVSLAAIVWMKVGMVTIYGYDIFLVDIILGVCVGLVLGFVARMKVKFKTR